ncbi:ribonuclease E/G [Allopontixanthobacter sp.]|uniref:ribonuclease E/G n=1 Tax=Allopontixanthobacter sp. TaxID=2906452 RepID=UPI002ABA978D|nr:ribonuclease E/G [Allopontixanthobacter sp.]MDZ4307048.1 ribonuclease E/G [Allopontixanthobacter sp.]
MKWYLEEGIGEHRAIAVAGGEIVAARLHWPGELLAGQVTDAVLLARSGGSSRGTAQLPSGEQVLVDRLPKAASEGAPLRVEITRPSMAERGRLKRALGRPTDKGSTAPTLAQTLAVEGCEAEIVRRFPVPGWSDVIADAVSGEVDFSGGSLLLSPTPAMVTIDIDGTLPPRELALAAIPSIARTLDRMDLGGSIGIDFPTLQTRQHRREVDEALDTALAGWPHERTSMNGFGFVQLVSRLSRKSLLHRAAHSRTGMAARLLLRQAEQVAEPGALLLTCHPAVGAHLTPEWQAELARRTGREIRIRAEPGLALEGGFAQAVPL